jgi:hypothetical protein
VKRIILLVVGFLMFSLSLSIFTSSIVFASSGNWSEVARFIDEGILFTTEPFTIYHVEWRIRWEYEPQTVNPEDPPGLQFYVYPHEPRSSWFESVSKWGTEETNGTLYIHDKNGTFHLVIVGAVKSYTLIVEQDLASIPEFHSWIILPLLLTATLAIMVSKKRLPKNR